MHGRCFCGWLIVAASFVILTLAYGLQFSYGVFLPHIMADLNLDRASASAPFSLYVVFYTFWSIVTGPATDRFGPRKVVIIGGLLLALGYFLLSSATEGWQLFLYFGAIAGAGMSAAYIPLNATVVRWFDQRRGLALAITGTGSNAAVLLLPMLSALLIPVLGWRDALLILGLGGSGVIICCALTLVRDPSAKNLAPDGQTVDQGVEGTPAGVQQTSLTLAQARAEPALWIIMGVFFLTWVMTFSLMYICLVWRRTSAMTPRVRRASLSPWALGAFPGGRLLVGCPTGSVVFTAYMRACYSKCWPA